MICLIGPPPVIASNNTSKFSALAALIFALILALSPQPAIAQLPDVPILEFRTYHSDWLRYRNADDRGDPKLSIEGVSQFEYSHIVSTVRLRMDNFDYAAELTAEDLIYDAANIIGLCDTNRLSNSPDTLCTPGTSELPTGQVLLALFHHETRELVALTTTIDNKALGATKADWSRPTPEPLAQLARQQSQVNQQQSQVSNQQQQVQQEQAQLNQQQQNLQQRQAQIQQQRQQLNQQENQPQNEQQKREAEQRRKQLEEQQRQLEEEQRRLEQQKREKEQQQRQLEEQQRQLEEQQKQLEKQQQKEEQKQKEEQPTEPPPPPEDNNEPPAEVTPPPQEQGGGQGEQQNQGQQQPQETPTEEPTEEPTQDPSLPTNREKNQETGTTTYTYSDGSKIKTCSPWDKDGNPREGGCP